MASASPPPLTPSEPPPSPPVPTPPPSLAPPTPPSDPPPAPYPPTYARPPPSDPRQPPFPPSPPTVLYPPMSSASSSSSITFVLAMAIGGLAALLLASILIIFLLRKKKRPAPPPPPPLPPPPTIPASPATPTQPATQPPRIGMASTTSPPADHPVVLPSKPLPPPAHGVVIGFSKSIFTYQELVMATDGFSDGNLLGKGGFGYVHKGILNGKKVAIKQLKAGSREGEREFQAELEAIGHVHHKHLVSLLGYCNSGSHRLLVYEFIPNKTLEFHLHGKDQRTMEWPVRLKIALSTAKGLTYLHEDCHPKIIHRDIKSANILLDYNLEAKVADFGLAKICSGNRSEVHTRVMGTLGYLAPEYATSHKLTTKSDVFSFGVLLLELITGRRPEELITGWRSVDSSQSCMDDSLVDWARPLLTRALGDGKCDALVDPQLKTYDPDQMARMIACAAACVRHSARHRPQMSKVVQALEGLVSPEDLYEGVRPGQSQCIRSSRSSDYHSGHYNKLMRDVSKMASRRDCQYQQQQ